MAEYSTEIGDGLELNLVIFEDAAGKKRSLVGIEVIGLPNSMVGLTNMQALNIAMELTALASVNSDEEASE